MTSGDFLGEESIADGSGLRTSTATAITACSALRIECDEMLRVIHEEQGFSDLFLKFLIARGVRAQADLIDQLFNNSEKRLARILLLMAEFGLPGKPGAPSSSSHRSPKRRSPRWWGLHGPA